MLLHSVLGEMAELQANSQVDSIARSMFYGKQLRSGFLA